MENRIIIWLFLIGLLLTPACKASEDDSATSMAFENRLSIINKTPFPYEGDTSKFECCVVCPNITQGAITWRLKGFILKNGQRVNESHGYDGCTYWSHLEILKSNWTDSGNVSCEFEGEARGMLLKASGSTYLAVLARPRLRIIPLYQMVVDLGNFTLTCEANVPDTGHPDAGRPVNFTWWEGDRLIIEAKNETISSGDFVSMLNVTMIDRLSSFRCSAENLAGKGYLELGRSDVFLQTFYRYCPEAEFYGLTWQSTDADTDARLYCPRNDIGNVTHLCRVPFRFPAWLYAEGHCRDKGLVDVSREIEDVKHGLGQEPAKTNELAQRLELSAMVTLSLESKPFGFVYRLVDDVFEVVTDLSMLHTLFWEPPFDREVASIIRTCSILTVEHLRVGCHYNPCATIKTDWEDLDSVLSRYTQAFSKVALNDGYRREFRSENIDMVVDFWTRMEGMLTFYLAGVFTSVAVPHKTLRHISEEIGMHRLVVSSINYKSATDIFQPNSDNARLASNIISLNIANLTYGHGSIHPIYLIFTKKKDLTENEFENCMFYENGNWSDSACTTLCTSEYEVYCECNRTGSFAIVVSNDTQTTNTRQVHHLCPPVVGIPYIKINATTISGDLKEGDTAVMECTALLNPPTPGGYFTWKLKGKALENGRRVNIETTLDSTGELHYSKLTVKDLSWKDDGIVHCNYIYDTTLSANKTARLNVLAKPTVKISSMSLTIEEGAHITLSCSASIPGSDNTDLSTLKWFRWNGAAKVEIPKQGSENETIIFSGGHMSSLRLTGQVVNVVSYGCTATNKAGVSGGKACKVSVIKKETPTCSQDTSGNVEWPKTAVGSTALKPCPGNATGQAYRLCLSPEKWDFPNFDNCIDKVYEDILDEISDVASGIGADSNKTMEIAESLEEAIDAEMNQSESSNKTMKAGNLNASLEAIDKLSEIHINAKQPPSHDEVQSIVQTCSALIDRQNDEAWKLVLRKNDTRATTVMDALDNYAESLARAFKDVKEKSIFEALNIVLIVQPWESSNGSLSYPERSGNLEGKWTQNTTDQVILSNATLEDLIKASGMSKLVISSTYYKILERLLPTNNAQSGPEISSKVLSLSVDNVAQPAKFETPVSFIFEMHSVFKETDTVVCSYWDFSSENGGEWSSSGCNTTFTNTTGTYCECNHMTNFAILVSRYNPPPHIHKALSTLTSIGCSVSTTGMTIMIGAYAILWKHIQIVVRGNMGRQITLVNLCGVLIIANLLFLFGVEQTESQNLCTAIAAVLQYLFLVAFALMLSLSVSLYWKVSSLARGMQSDKASNIAFSMLVSWVSPAFIVGISLGVTRTKGYGTRDYCWLSMKGAIWSFLGPVILVVLTNFIILIVAMRAKIKSQMFGKRNNNISSNPLKESDIIRSTFWSLMVLVPVMGINWIFGIFAVNNETVVFQFIFAIFNSFQGCFIFIFHCLMDASVQKAFQLKFGRKLCQKNKKNELIKPRHNKGYNLSSDTGSSSPICQSSGPSTELSACGVISGGPTPPAFTMSNPEDEKLTTESGDSTNILPPGNITEN